MSIILSAHNLKKEFGGNLIFDRLCLELKAGEKAALIGANGAGKTTLLKCLLGMIPPDEGAIKLEPGISIGYVEQISSFEPETTLWEALESSFEDLKAQGRSIRKLEQAMANLSHNELETTVKKYGELLSSYENQDGFSYEVKIRKILLGLGFKEDQFQRSFGSFSGGEKTKITLGCLLARERQIMFLDEPTNHLDLESLEWLEEYLKTSSSGIIVISHDRFFLDRVTGTTFNLENGCLKRYNGAYSSFAKQKEAEETAYARAYEKQQQEIQELTDYINKYRAGIKSKQARGRQSRLQRMEVLAKVRRQKALSVKAVKLDRSGDKVLSLENLSYAFPDKELFSGIDQEIFSGRRVAVIGPNGAGKSTLLKIIIDQLKPGTGHLNWGVNIKMGYFAQTHENLNQSNTVLDEVISGNSITLQEARDYLAAFLFFEDDISKKVANLSGGERARLSFLKLYLTKANFLILDEPTNHMDIASREAFEDFLKEYPGTILAVSHDRFFIDAIADQIWELREGALKAYEGNYTRFKEIALQTPAPSLPPVNKAQKVKEYGSKPNLNQALLRSRKAFLRKRLAELENILEKAESRLEELNGVLADGNIYQQGGDELKSVLEEYESLEKAIPQYYEEWAEAEEELNNYT